jgi:hypothetical protein
MNQTKFESIVDFFSKKSELPNIFIESWIMGVFDNEALSPYWLDDDMLHKMMTDDDIWNTWCLLLKKEYSNRFKRKNNRLLYGKHGAF